VVILEPKELRDKAWRLIGDAEKTGDPHWRRKFIKEAFEFSSKLRPSRYRTPRGSLTTPIQIRIVYACYEKIRTSYGHCFGSTIGPMLQWRTLVPTLSGGSSCGSARTASPALRPHRDQIGRN
jgi:hypothetical protein